jgi:hypothetical protein
MSERSNEEQRLADLLKQAVPEPPRQLTYEEITVRNMEKSVRSWLMPAMAAATVLVIGGAIGAVAATRPDPAAPRATAAAQGTSPAGTPTPQPTSPGCPGTAAPTPSASPTTPQGASVAVPSVVGLQVSAAEQVLAQAGLAVFIKAAPVHAVPAGMVVLQSPAQGTRAPRGAVVSLTMAATTATAQPTPIPSATAEPTPSPSCSAPVSSASATPVPASSPSVAATPTPMTPSVAPTPASSPSGAATPTPVGKGSTRVTAPNVVGMQEMQAQTLLQQAGFNVVVVYAPEPNGQPRGTVFNQSPAAGTVVARGSQITIYAKAA